MTAFHNRIRLPLKIYQPQFPETRTEYRKTSGDTFIQSVVVRKTYEGLTDYLAEGLHQKLKVALVHDHVQIEAPNYFGQIAQSADYEIQWVGFRDYPIAQAKFQVEVTPFDVTNSNCQTCADVTQVVANDDTFPSPLNEDTDYILNVQANDEICCFPITFTITSYNADYLSSCTIDSAGVLHVHVKSDVVAANGIKLATYRVTCPNGNYDEADVTGNINGTVPGCLAPLDVAIDVVTKDGVLITFTPPSPAPDHYSWKIFNVGTSVYDQTGDVSASPLSVIGLSPATSYKLYLRSQCDATDSDGDASNYIEVDFTTNPNTILCGSYTIRVDDPTIPDGGHITITYVDCNGIKQNTTVLNNYINRTFCFLQTSPGSPTYLVISSSSAYTTVTYNGAC